MGNPWKKGEEKQFMVELGADTDPAVCKKMKGKMGSDGRCRPVLGRMNKDGDIVLKNVSGDDDE